MSAPLSFKNEVAEKSFCVIYDVNNFCDQSKDPAERTRRERLITKLFQNAHFALHPIPILKSSQERLYACLSSDEEESQESPDDQIEDYKCEGFFVVDIGKEESAGFVTKMEFDEENDKGLYLILGSLKRLQEIGKKELCFSRLSLGTSLDHLMTFLKTSQGKSLAAGLQQQILVTGPEKGNYKVSMTFLESPSV